MKNQEAPRARAAMVVDGSPSSRRLVAGILAKLGLASVGFSTGEEALASLEANPPPALVCVDMALPCMSGFRFCSLARSCDRLRDVPFLALSSRGEWADHAFALEVGVDEFLEKRAGTRAISAAARALIERRAPRANLQPASLGVAFGLG